MIELITSRDSWVSFMESFGHPDFYFTYYYHFLSKRDNETPVLIAYREGESAIALPLMFRDIPGTSYRDATSVYGYAGPLCSTNGNDLSEIDFARFQSELHQFLMENKIVSVFTRLHPYISYQIELIEGLGTISSPGQVVNIDLNLPVDIQRQKYSSRLKTYINKARRRYTVVEGKDEEQIEEFIEMYYENMRRVDANDYYFFDKRYFYQLMISSFFKVELLLCSETETGKMIGGAMFVKTGDIVQYHLSGFKEEYMNLNPIKLLIDEMRLRATEEGFTYFNLGGGKGVEEDSLFRFKASFSKDLKPAQFWKYIVNQEVYEDLTDKSGAFEAGSVDSAETASGFFPAYRSRPLSASES